MLNQTFKKNPYALIQYNLKVIWPIYLSVLVISLFNPWQVVFTYPHLWVWLLAVVLIALPHFGISIVGCLGIALLHWTYHWTDLTVWHAVLFFLAMVVGLLSATLMHNAAHKNIRPNWLCHCVGELCGLQQMLGYQEWAFAHMIHHQNPDDPEKDPHPPLDFPFWKFLLEMKFFVAKKFEMYYFEQWGNTPKYKKIWGHTGIVLTTSLLLRGIVTFLLLGSTGMTFFFIPAYLINMIFYAHFNYYTHRPKADGAYEILNLNHNLFYQLLNLITFGCYYHKNHHLKPYYFNPKHAKFESEATGANS